MTFRRTDRGVGGRGPGLLPLEPELLLVLLQGRQPRSKPRGGQMPCRKPDFMIHFVFSSNGVVVVVDKAIVRVAQNNCNWFWFEPEPSSSLHPAPYIPMPPLERHTGLLGGPGFTSKRGTRMQGMMMVLSQIKRSHNGFVAHA